MSFRCHNGPEHHHQTVYEAKVCWGVITPPPAPTVHVRLATPAQLKYIGDLGGDVALAATMPVADASSYIDELKRRPKMLEEPPPPPAPTTDPRLEFVKMMLTSVESGYYATQQEEGADVFFMRVARPKHGEYKGCIKVQSMHGTASLKPYPKDALILYPSGKYYFKDRYFREPHWREKLIESIMLLVADTWGAQRRYSEKIGRCCRCNAALTDERSRHYGIGPECEKHWPWILEAVDAADALKAD